MRTNQQHFFFVLIVSEVSQSSDSSEGDCEWDGSFDQDEEEILKYYFYRGFSYQEILCFLSDRHRCQISYSTLLRKLKKYRLFRRGVTKQESFSDTFLKVQGRMSELINGPCSALGYRAIWHTLEMEGLRIPRVIVQDLLKEMDPEGSELRRKHRLKRRVYQNPGPNYSWHIDGYDKLKCWGFPIHGAIDGFSRRILWLEITRSNNSPNKIATFYARTVAELEGCPVELITDLGTENGLAAAMQSFFRDNPEAHRYVSSPRNQRIEGWWSYYSKNRCIWWRNLFSDLEFQGIVDTTSEISLECLWYCFNKVLQKELDSVKEHWNTHRIRKSRNDTVPGRPDSLFFLPDLHGAKDCLVDVPAAEIEFGTQLITEELDGTDNEHQEYFDYARVSLSMPLPDNWEEALQLYKKLMHAALHGYSS